MCDRPHDKAVRSPWTEGAWVMRTEDIPSGWSWRYHPVDLFHNASDDATPLAWSIVEAKP
jgi:hypothetical protein